MAWKNGFYYRNRRVGGRVVTEYVGNSYGAVLVARLDERDRAEHSEQRAVLQTTMATEMALDAQLDAISAQLQMMVAATLLLAGYHQHKRQWRKTRD